MNIDNSYLPQRETWSRIKEGGRGEVVSGVVKNITNYGAFITVDEFDGLLHLRNISWRYVRHPSDVLEIGQEIDVVVLDIDLEKERVEFGLKQLYPDLWSSESWGLSPGDEFEGRIIRAWRYGVFVEILPGIEGLMHALHIVKTFPSLPELKKCYKKRKEKKEEFVKELEKHFKKGERIHVVVFSFDKEAKEIGLNPKV